MLHETSAPKVQAPEWYAVLKEKVNLLINEDFDALLQLLYRVDVSEAKLRAMLQNLAGTDAAEIITNLLLERQLQKIRSRAEYKASDKPATDDEERW